MNNVYVRLTECDLQKMREALMADERLGLENLVAKLELMLKEMQPGTCLTLEAVKATGSRCSSG